MYNGSMMQYGFGYGGMMGGAGIWSSIVMLILLIDLVLVGIWLWKQINK